MNKRNISSLIISAAAVLTLTTACGSSDAAKQPSGDAAKQVDTAVSDAAEQVDTALSDAGVDVQQSGDLPKGFPAEVPTPELKLETAVGAAGIFTLRYTSKDANADIAAYTDKLKAAGFIIDLQSEDPVVAKNVVVTAEKGKLMVAASAFAPGAPGGGDYMGVVVTPLP